MLEHFTDAYEHVVALHRTGNTPVALAKIGDLLMREDFNVQQQLALRNERTNLLLHLGREDEAREQ